MTSDPLAITSAPAPAVRPSWIALKACAASVAKARRFAADVTREHVVDDGHIDDIVLVVSELLTNALRAAHIRRWEPGDLPLRFGILATGRYVHLYVTDPDPRPIGVGAAPVNGWGLGIVDTYAAARWTTYTEQQKTVHAVIPAPGVDLNPAEIEAVREGRAPLDTSAGPA